MNNQRKGGKEMNRKKGDKIKEEKEAGRERMVDHSHFHGLPTLAHKIPSPNPTHEQSCQEILTRLDNHQARHRHS
jgi:hypothetical protein